MKCKSRDGTIRDVSWRFVYADCFSPRPLCRKPSGAWLPAITICNQALFATTQRIIPVVTSASVFVAGAALVTSISSTTAGGGLYAAGLAGLSDTFVEAGGVLVADAAIIQTSLTQAIESAGVLVADAAINTVVANWFIVPTGLLGGGSAIAQKTYTFVPASSGTVVNGTATVAYIPSSPTHLSSLQLWLNAAQGVSTEAAAAFVAASNQSLSIADQSAVRIDLSTPVTFFVLVYFTTFPASNDGTIISKDDGLTGSGSDYLLTYAQADVPATPFIWQLQQAGGGNSVVQVQDSEVGVGKTGQWYGILCGYDKVGNQIFLRINDGTNYTASTSGFTINQSSTPFALGINGPGAANNSPLNGRIGFMGRWNRLLTGSEQTAVFNMVTSGSVNNPGTLQSGATYSADVPSALSSNVNSVSFDGSTGYITLGSANILQSSNAAISCWFKAAAFGGVIVGKASNANTYIRVLNATTIRVQTDVVSTFKDFTVPTMSTGTWYNLIVVRDGSSNTHVYLNGTESSSGGQSQPTNPMSIDQIGRYWNGGSGLWWSGKLAQIEFLNYTPSGSDIAALAAGTAPSTAPFALYLLDEGSGTTANDTGTGSTVTSAGGIRSSTLPSSLQPANDATCIQCYDLTEKSGMRFDKTANALNLTSNNGVTVAVGPAATSALNKDAIYLQNDQSGNGLNATQTTASAWPVYQTNVLNGLPALHFDGSSYLTVASTSLGTAHTTFFVVRFPSSVSGVLLGNTSGNAVALLDATNLNYDLGGSAVSVAHGLSANQWAILAVRRNGTTVRFYKNGVQLGSDQTLSANSAATISTVGAYSNGSSAVTCDLPEGPLVYNRSLSDDEVGSVFLYLDNKYGVY